MFNRNPGGPAGGPPEIPNGRLKSAQGGADKPSIIGFGLTITGNLESKGEIQIEGEVHGDIHAARVIVGEQGNVTGNVIANDIIVRGTVGGSIKGNNVTVQASSRVEGDIFHKLLAIEQGAYFEGRARRSEDPMATHQATDDPRPAGVVWPPAAQRTS
jgi:cytoskeletal protein CcmA (bactofilin family)